VSSLYAMQRANGDWFAVDDHGGFRVPLFNDNREAMRARAYNTEMLVFKPILLDETEVKTLAPEPGERVEFWLVDKGSTNMKRGRLMDHAQVALLVRNSS